MTKQKVKKMLAHSEKKLAEWQKILVTTDVYTRKNETAKSKVYDYKYEVMNLKEALVKIE